MVTGNITQWSWYYESFRDLAIIFTHYTIYAKIHRVFGSQNIFV